MARSVHRRAPVYNDPLGAFDCTVDQIVERGDVSIVIGTVVAVASRVAASRWFLPWQEA
jgi:flavin reductase (DIM6/NTAB) family NADH-FMN oxidoreductase RutF